MAKPQSITSVGISADQERKQRMMRYLIAMAIRTVCLILGVYTQGWAMWLFFAGAILLPYFAVVLANDHGSSRNNSGAGLVEVTPLAIKADASRPEPKDV